MKKVSKLLVIFAAAVAMVLMMGCQQPSGGSGSSGGNKPSSNPSGGGKEPAITELEELIVLGAYKSGGAILSFDEYKKGSYTVSSSNMRAAGSIDSFDWKVIEQSSDNIKIEITYKVGGEQKKGTLTLSNGKISGKLNDSDEQSSVTNMSLELPKNEDAVGTWKLSYPSQSEMDAMLRKGYIDWYPVSTSFNADHSGNAKVRHLDGSGIVERDVPGNWLIVNTGKEAGSIILVGEDTSRSLIKLSTNKKEAYVLDNYAGAMRYTKQ